MLKVLAFEMEISKNGSTPFWLYSLVNFIFGCLVFRKSKKFKASSSLSKIAKISSTYRKFKILEEDPTSYRQGQLQRRLLKLKKKSFFSQETYDKIYPKGSKPARLYGLPKMHKTFEHIPPFRPIVSSIGTFNHKLASFLGGLVTNVTPTDYSCSDTFNFLVELNKHDIKGKFSVSFDVCSLFTNIPLNETLDLAIDLILKKDPNLRICHI